MKIRTQFDRCRVRTDSPIGVAKIYEERLNADGVMELVHTGNHDLNEFVQASLDGTKVYSILERFAKTQDPSIFNVSQGYYADVSSMPKDLLQVQNMLLNVDKQFSQLPSDVKEKYGNNVYKFYEAVLSGQFAADFGENAQNIVDQTAAAAADQDVKVGDI